MQQQDHAERDGMPLPRPPPAPQRVWVEVPAVPDVLAPVRWQLGAWLDHAGVNDEDKLAIQSAADEATTNAVEHAYHERPPGPLRFFAGLDPGPVVRIEVADGGRWRPERDPAMHYRGRGLELMQRMMDHVEITTAETGTKVVMRRQAPGTATSHPCRSQSG
jgi:anti-sigma regulatory factor (Ser/Thr protein kinase)